MKHFLTVIAFIFLFNLIFSVDAFSQCKVACIGNSVTFGYKVDRREENCYPARLQQKLGSGYEVRNFGHSGATLLKNAYRPYWNTDEYKNALAFSPDRVIIHLGLNDTDPRAWNQMRDEFRGDYIDLIRSFREVNPEVQIWICRLSPITSEHMRFKSGTRDWYWMLQKEIEEIAVEEQVALIDLQAVLYDRPDLLPDALHPVAEGADMIADKIASHLTGDFGGLSVSPLYADHMVLQREVDFICRGIANAGETVEVKFGKNRHKVVAGKNGQWSVNMGSYPAGGRFSLQITASGASLKYKDVTFGDVWVCSGQSNMAFMVSESAEKEELLAGLPQGDIRFFDMKPRYLTNNVAWDSTALEALNRYDHYRPASWSVADANRIAGFSAIGYSFGKMLSDSLRVPVGLICNAVGGSPLEAWIDRTTLEFDPVGVYAFHDWLNNDMIYKWVRERAAKNIEAKTIQGQHHPYEPSYLWKSGMEPLTEFPVKGIVWYQGESNEHNIELFSHLFPLAVKSWRKSWGAELPVYFVQLSSISRPTWPWMREAQLKMSQEIPFTGMAVSFDKGDSLDVHPRQKREIGQRLGLQALNKTYGRKDLICDAPRMESYRFENGGVSIVFDSELQFRPDDENFMEGFELMSSKGKVIPAHARLTSAKEVFIPFPMDIGILEIRYGWRPYGPVPLRGESGLPVSTFRIVR